MRAAARSSWEIFGRYAYERPDLSRSSRPLRHNRTRIVIVVVYARPLAAPSASWTSRGVSAPPLAQRKPRTWFSSSPIDRKSVVSWKRVSVLVHLGGRRRNQTKKQENRNI